MLMTHWLKLLKCRMPRNAPDDFNHRRFRGRPALPKRHRFDGRQTCGGRPSVNLARMRSQHRHLWRVRQRQA